MQFNFPWWKKNKAITITRDSVPIVAPDPGILPEKIFIEREVDKIMSYEYSTQDPAIVRQLLDGYYSKQNFIELFHSLPEIFAPINEIASRVADAVWELCANQNDKVIYNNADFNRLFSQPNPLFTMHDMVYTAICYEILTGRQFFYANKPELLSEFDNLSGTQSWFNLPAHEVVAEMQNNDPYSSTTITDFVKRYKLPIANGTRYFDSNNVMPVLHLDLKRGYNINYPKPIILGAECPIKNLIPVYQARGIIYIKRGELGLFVNKAKDQSGNIPLSDAERLELTKLEEQNYGITGNKSPIKHTSANVDFVRTSMSIQELQPFDETLSDAIAIYKVLRVPRHLVPDFRQTTFSNADADMKSFYSDVIIPWAKKYAKLWSNWFNIPNRYIRPNFDHVDVLQENKVEASKVDSEYGKVWEQRWRNGICSLNDWIVAIDGTAGIGSIYEKKIFEMDDADLAKVKDIILKQSGSGGSVAGGGGLPEDVSATK